MIKNRIFALLAALTVIALLPTFALSDEAKVRLEALKTKATTSIAIATTTLPVAEFENKVASAAINLTDQKAASFTIGSSKKAVIDCLGTPIYDGGYYLKYGLQEAVHFENDRVVSWHGFSESDDKFDISKRKIAVKPTNINPKTSRPYSYRATHRQKKPKEEVSIFSLFTEILESTPSTSDVSTQPRLSSGNYTTHTGPRGGVYHYSASGKKVYHKKR